MPTSFSGDFLPLTTLSISPASVFLPLLPPPASHFFLFIGTTSEVKYLGYIATASLEERALKHFLGQSVCKSTVLPHHCTRLSFPMSSQKLFAFESTYPVIVIIMYA